MQVNYEPVPAIVPPNYFRSAFSTAPANSGESGSTPDSKRVITFPFPSTRNLVKFHLTSPPAVSVRNFYSGALSQPLTEILEYMGKVTPQLRAQNVSISSLLPCSSSPK